MYMQYNIVVNVNYIHMLHASPVWMRNVELLKRSRRLTGASYCVTNMVGDIDVCRFQSINRYPILSIVQLYTEALVGSR